MKNTRMMVVVTVNAEMDMMRNDDIIIAQLEEAERRAHYWDYENAYDPEYEAWEAETIAWLRDPKNFDDINYSDIFKELYGVRPRW